MGYDHPITPSRGKSYFASVGFAGGPLGGSVNLIEPTLSYTHFVPGGASRVARSINRGNNDGAMSATAMRNARVLVAASNGCGGKSTR